MLYIWMSVCHTYEWGVWRDIWDVCPMTHLFVTWLMYVCNVMHMNEWCHTYEWGVWRDICDVCPMTQSMNYVRRRMSHVTNAWHNSIVFMHKVMYTWSCVYLRLSYIHSSMCMSHVSPDITQSYSWRYTRTWVTSQTSESWDTHHRYRVTLLIHMCDIHSFIYINHTHTWVTSLIRESWHTHHTHRFVLLTHMCDITHSYA